MIVGISQDAEAARYLTAEQVARALSVSRSTAYRLMHEMGRVRVGRVVRVSREAFETWLAAQTERERRERSKRSASILERRADGQLTLGFPERR